MIKFLLKVFCVFLFVSCTKQEPPSDEKLKKIFFAYKEKFIDLKELCYQNKELRTIDISKKEILNNERKKIPLIETEKILNKIAKTKINPFFKKIQCLRVYENDNFDIVSVRFVYHSVGMVGSGNVKGIEYKNDVEKIKFPFGEKIFRKIEKEENWFIYDRKDN